jgi:Ca-activated chloride channel family protein
VILVAVVTARQQQAVFRADLDVARIDVSVMNGLTPVAGLTRDQFVVTDNGVVQTVDAVSMDTAPLDLTLVLDTSASMRFDRIKQLIEASKTLVTGLRPDDQAALVTFADPIALAKPMTSDRTELLAALDGLVANGSTALNDAVFFALQLRPTEPGSSRPVLLVFSDGHDNSSWLTGEQLLEATRRSGMVMHVIELIAPELPGALLRPSEFLHELAKAGGGRHWVADKASDLNNLFGKALNELRARYLLTYAATGVKRQGWHDVKVTLKGARGDVTARPGYFVQ